MKKYTLLIVLIISACSQIDQEREKSALLAINNEQREAHMSNDAGLLVSSMADSVISIDSGEITVVSKSDMEQRFASYFSTVKYSAWDDLVPPSISISNDGSLATMSVKKRTITSSNGSHADTTIFAWTSAFKKVNKQWKMYSITSTDNR